MARIHGTIEPRPVRGSELPWIRTTKDQRIETGKKFKAARIAKDWTVSDFAKLTGLSFGIIKRVERGDFPFMSAEDILKFTTRLGLKLKDVGLKI